MTVYYDPELGTLEPPEWATPPSKSHANWPVALAAVALALVTVIGVVLVLNFVDSERERDVRAWQVRMGIVADSRFAAVNDWLDRQFGVVRDLAENASLQLYLTELQLSRADSERGPEAPAEFDYLRNLLLASAERGGFSAPLHGPDINANVQRIGVAGIALLDNDAEIIVATDGMPPVDERIRNLVFSNRGDRAIFDLHLGVGGEPTIGFLAPVFAVQSSGLSSEQIGVVIGIKEVGDELYPLLKQPGNTEATAESVLVRTSGEAIEYLSPLADGTRPLRLSLARRTDNLAAAFAVDAPGGFAIREDYRGDEVLVLSRRFAAAPWTLMYKVGTGEALGETDARLRRTLTVLLLVVAAVSAALVAAWRHGTSRRASEAAQTSRETARRFAEQRNFLHLVTDSQPGAMAIVDDNGTYLWANRSLCDNVGLAGDEIVGKTVSSVLGPVPARDLLGTVRDVLAHGASEVRTHSEERDGRVFTYQSEFVPLPATEDMPARVLMASEDVTTALEEKAKRERIMDQLVTTLVNVVDRRDPYSANHSSWVAKVAHATAEEMGLDSIDADCVEVAGRLMNLGKILVPEALLTKTTPLSESEMELIRNSIRTSADLLDGIEFDGPVVETLRQLHDYRDDGDPDSQSDSDILITTRIIAVTNTFVAMVSPRAYRPGLAIDSALDSLLSKMGSGANRRVVLALANYLDNHGGRAKLADIGERPAGL